MLRTIRNYAAGALLGGFTLVLPIVLLDLEANWFWVASAFFWGLLIVMLYVNRGSYPKKIQLFRVSILETSIFCLELAAIIGSIALVMTQDLLTLPSVLLYEYDVSFGILAILALTLLHSLKNTLKWIEIESFMFGEGVNEFQGLRTHAPSSEWTYSNSFLDLYNFLHFQLLGHYLGNHWTFTNEKLASKWWGDSLENYVFTCWRDKGDLEDEFLGRLVFVVSRNRLSDDEANNAIIDVMRASSIAFATDDEYEERAASMTIEKFSHKDRDFGFSVEQNSSGDMRVLATVLDSKVVAIMAYCSGNPESRIMDTFNEIKVRDWCSVGEAALASQRPLD